MNAHFDVMCAILAMKTSTHYYYTTDLKQISTHLIQIIYIIDIHVYNYIITRLSLLAPDLKPIKSV